MLMEHHVIGIECHIKDYVGEVKKRAHLLKIQKKVLCRVSTLGIQLGMSIG